MKTDLVDIKKGPNSKLCWKIDHLAEGKLPKLSH